MAENAQICNNKKGDISDEKGRLLIRIIFAETKTVYGYIEMANSLFRLDRTILLKHRKTYEGNTETTQLLSYIYKYVSIVRRWLKK